MVRYPWSEIFIKPTKNWEQFDLLLLWLSYIFSNSSIVMKQRWKLQYMDKKNEIELFCNHLMIKIVILSLFQLESASLLDILSGFKYIDRLQ